MVYQNSRCSSNCSLSYPDFERPTQLFDISIPYIQYRPSSYRPVVRQPSMDVEYSMTGVTRIIIVISCCKSQKCITCGFPFKLASYYGNVYFRRTHALGPGSHSTIYGLTHINCPESRYLRTCMWKTKIPGAAAIVPCASRTQSNKLRTVVFLLNLKAHDNHVVATTSYVQARTSFTLPQHRSSRLLGLSRAILLGVLQ